MPSRILGALGKNTNDIIKIELSISTFIREISKILGILPIDITIRSKSSLSDFFVFNSTANYNALIGKDWIHTKPSSLHQFLLLWKGNEVAVVWTDKYPFTTNSDIVEAAYYD